jgi:hypothetical protein
MAIKIKIYDTFVVANMTGVFTIGIQRDGVTDDGRHKFSHALLGQTDTHGIDGENVMHVGRESFDLAEDDFMKAFTHLLFLLVADGERYGSERVWNDDRHISWIFDEEVAKWAWYNDSELTTLSYDIEDGLVMPELV